MSIDEATVAAFVERLPGVDALRVPHTSSSRSRWGR